MVPPNSSQALLYDRNLDRPTKYSQQHSLTRSIKFASRLLCSLYPIMPGSTVPQDLRLRAIRLYKEVSVFLSAPSLKACSSSSRSPTAAQVRKRLVSLLNHRRSPLTRLSQRGSDVRFHTFPTAQTRIMNSTSGSDEYTRASLPFPSQTPHPSSWN